MGWEKKSRADDSRALMSDALDAFLGKVDKKPLQDFVRFAKEHTELELCLRGNSKDNPRISIYCNNHIIFTVCTTGKVVVSFNHARYCENWRYYYDSLVNKYGFRGTIKNTESGIDVGEMTRTLRCNEAMNLNQIDALYEDVLQPMFYRYFEVEGKEGIVDYFKDGKTVSVSGKTEKRIQQKLYHQFAYQEDGYFFYDLEFAQRHGSMEEQACDTSNNKPDMLALRFDAQGKPEKIVFVEVKSTEAAMRGTSGISEHIEKMEAYDKLHERRVEACQIMNQYALLGLRGLSGKSYNHDDFKNLPREILLIFTGEAAEIWENDPEFEKDRQQTDKIDTPQGVDAVLYIAKSK